MIVKARVGMGLVGCERRFEVEIPDEDLEGLTAQEREEVIHEWVEAEVNNFVEWGWEEV